MFANQKIIKNRNVIFMEDSMSGGNNLEMQIGRNDGPMVVVMDESFKSFSCHTVRSVRSKWKIIWLQINILSYDPW